MKSKKGKDAAGPPTWETLHLFAAAYKPSPENAKAFKMFVYSLMYLFPCDICKVHLRQNLENLPIDPYLDSNHNLYFWTYTLHDIVNVSVNKYSKHGQKKKISPPYHEIKAYHFNAVGEECRDCQVN